MLSATNVGHGVEELTEDKPATPNRLQLLVNSGALSLSSTASVSATSTASGMANLLSNVERGRIVDMASGVEYEWPMADHKERPPQIFDVRSLSNNPRSWLGAATDEIPRHSVLDVSSGSAFRLGFSEARPTWPFGFHRIDVRSS